MSRHIIAAAGAEGFVLTAAKRMTVAPRRQRIELRDRCAPVFEELRRLALAHFANRPAIPQAIDDLERAVSELAALPGAPVDGPASDYECPACGALLDRRGTYGVPDDRNPTDIYCQKCLEIVMPALQALRSLEEGFGTDAI
jgi:hypothetical protein